jgi:hypothetical protein
MNYTVKSYNLTGGETFASITSSIAGALDQLGSLWEVAESGSGYLICRPKDETKLVRVGFNSSDNTVTVDEKGLIQGIPSGWETFSDMLVRATFAPSSTISNFQFVQVDDAIFILLQNSSGHYVNGCHAGRIFTPFLQNDPDNGMSGYGVLSGGLIMGEANNSKWGTIGNDASNTAYSVVNRIRVSFGPLTSVAIGTGAIASAWISPGFADAYFSTTATSASSSINIGGRKQPIPLLVHINSQPLTANTTTPHKCRTVGVLKYVYLWPWALSNKTVLKSNTSDQAFAVFYEGNSASGLTYPLIPWEDPDISIT